ncbi:DGQHR domain-containing protein [Gluconobacter sp. LMG 1745]|uniref:DGQHR domain-containing protein n=2 Tax=Gluconobacter cadivus TaxID=2728101 RepID=A0ABR9YYG5_9PROT|nr:DGQHR domain-containing protein [Gluconobacter cadivus]
MPSDILSETCVVTTRVEDPKAGFQRELDEKRALEIARYIDEEEGTIPNSIVLSAQSVADLKIVGRGKTLEFNRLPGAFLILDGQHRVYGFSKAKTTLRVPVVIYNGLSRRDETRLFIDINTKQKPVPSQLLLDIKQLAESESEAEEVLRELFDLFHDEADSALSGYMSPATAVKGKITRVTFNNGVKPLLQLFSSRETNEVYQIINSYLKAVSSEISKKTLHPLLAKPVIFRAFLALFPLVAQRYVDKHENVYTADNFQRIIQPVFSNISMAKFEKTGTSWSSLKEYLEKRLTSKLSL